MEPLDFRRQQGLLHAGAVQQLVHRLVHLADLHDVDAVFGGRGNLDELSADVGAGPVELMAFEGRHDKYLDAFSPHAGRHQLHGEALARAAGA